MGISEIEIIGPDDEDGDGPDFEPAAAAGSGSGSGPDRGSGPRWYRPANAPVLASLAVVLLVVAGAAFAAVQRNRSGDDFGLALISAQYTIRQDASGLDLTLAVQNTGSTMVELTGVSLYQPGLVRQTQTGDGTGVTETEAGAATASALGPGTAITSLAITPKDVEVVTVPFRYDCGVSTFPAVSRSLSLAGFSARGTARTARLTLPTDVTPWQDGNIVRQALCEQPTPESDLSLAYGAGTGSTQIPQAPMQFTYTLVLSASGAGPVTVSSVSLANPGIATSVEPKLPVTLVGGESVRLNVTWYVKNCVIATSAHSADGVNITASASQNVQTWVATLGAQFVRELDAGVGIACSGNY